MKNSNLSTLLLEWYQKHGRDLPWREKGGAHHDPYAVLVSEVMLQQTTVATVIPYFERFMKRFPTIQSLAQASIEEVYQYWQGLGYYTRARSLHATAQIIAKQGWPQTLKDALKLKGLGPYTAASFLALAFNHPETVVDGNVIRIICRLHHLKQPVKEILPQIHELAEKITDKKNPADYASAIMDLGALICTPKNPQCLLCPWQKHCQSFGKEDIEEIPLRKQPQKIEKKGFVYLIFNSKKEIFIRKRTEKGLLSGLWEFPWDDNLTPHPNTQKTDNSVTHIFTHIKLTLQISICHTNTLPMKGVFVLPSRLQNYPMSTLMKKIIKTAKL